MLIYLGRGKRRYGEAPIQPARRRAWEFQAVLRGRLAPLFPEGPGPIEASHLWIFPPGHAHGWTSEQATTAEVAVFHFLSAPELLSRMLDAKGYLELALTPANVRQIRELTRKVGSYWEHPAPGMILCYEYALAALSLMACEALARQPQSKRFPEGRVNAAMVWYAERMEQSPSFPDLARAVGVSPAHLRRLFHEVLQASPAQVFDQLRFQRAIQLMSEPSVKLEEVGERCGFGSASSFSRAFKNKFGCSPQAWQP